MCSHLWVYGFGGLIVGGLDLDGQVAFRGILQYDCAS